jgi:hypothetical protein
MKSRIGSSVAEQETLKLLGRGFDPHPVRQRIYGEDMNELFYLAMPYSHKDPAVIERRMEIFCRVDAFLMKSGIHTVSPVSKHFMLSYEALPGDYNYWGTYSRKLMQRCDGVYVICIDGWKESVGVQDEIALAKQLNLPIIMVDEQGNVISQ